MCFSHQIFDYLIIKLYFPKIIKKQSSFYDEIGKLYFITQERNVYSVYDKFFALWLKRGI